GDCRAKVTGWRRRTPSRKPNTPLQNESAIQANSSVKQGRKIGLESFGSRATPAARARAARRDRAASRRSRAEDAGPGLGQGLAAQLQDRAQVDRLLAVGLEVDEQPPSSVPAQGFD